MAQLTTQEVVLDFPITTTVYLDDYVQLQAARSPHLMGYSAISMNTCFEFMLKDNEQKRFSQTSWQRFRNLLLG